MEYAYLKLPSLTKEQHEAIVNAEDKKEEMQKQLGLPDADTYRTIWVFDGRVYQVKCNRDGIEENYQAHYMLGMGYCSVVPEPEPIKLPPEVIEVEKPSGITEDFALRLVAAASGHATTVLKGGE